MVGEPGEGGGGNGRKLFSLMTLFEVRALYDMSDSCWLDVGFHNSRHSLNCWIEREKKGLLACMAYFDFFQNDSLQ